MILRVIDERATYRISSPSRIAIEDDSPSTSLTRSSSGCAAVASVDDDRYAWPRLSIFGPQRERLAVLATH